MNLVRIGRHIVNLDCPPGTRGHVITLTAEQAEALERHFARFVRDATPEERLRYGEAAEQADDPASEDPGPLPPREQSWRDRPPLL